ncbi:hypothetical protein ACFPPD_15850 [Cohnella suwonensis]|uniref:DUF2140 domain-containing protein n=1 Tax=Cohnella suwonensis TaxID=696072 RepID=A0ABW0LZK9_9BACL
MRKWLIGFFVFAIIVVGAGVGALYYAKPDRNLDLAYENVPLKDRALSMAKRMSTELSLTDEDIVNLAKKSLAEQPQVEKDVLVTGADFRLEGDLLHADLNVIWKDKISAGLKVDYRLRWADPNVIATAESARLKGVKLPLSMFADRVIPIGDRLPELLHIKSLNWGDGKVDVLFKKPSMNDLRSLIGG